MATPTPPPRKNIGARINADLADELRTFVRDNAGRPLFLTVTNFLEDAIAAHLERCKGQLEGREPAAFGRNGQHRKIESP